MIVIRRIIVLTTTKLLAAHTIQGIKNIVRYWFSSNLELKIEIEKTISNYAKKLKGTIEYSSQSHPKYSFSLLLK